MKNILLLLLLFTGFTGFALSPIINDPSPLRVCDSLNDGFETYNLTVKTPEILGSLNPDLFILTFYETFIDSQFGTNPIQNISNFTNITQYIQTIHIRVQDISDGSYSITTLDLVLNPMPTIGIPLNLSIEQIPFIGNAFFDLTSNNLPLINNNLDSIVNYFTTQSDAISNSNQIPNPTTFLGVNGQIIWAIVANASTQCASIASFQLYITNPNIVNIPDVNFKNKLLQASPTYYIAKNLSGVFFKVDSNSDGEIQVTEASQVSYLFLREMNISDITGIESFVNISELICEVNTISILNISNLTNLTILRCGNNNLASISVSSLVNLIQFSCEKNLLTNLNIDNLTNLVTFNCSFNQLTSLNVSNQSNLVSLIINNNAIATINLASNTNLATLFCYENQLTNLDVSNLNGLISIWCFKNSFPILNIENLPNLNTIVCGNDLQTQLNLSNLPSLTHLSCGSLGITTLNLSSLLGLTYLDIGLTNITSIDLNNLINLQTINISGNPNLISLDLSSNPNLYNITIHANNALKYINLKNGSVQNIDGLFYDSSLPSLEFICGDESELAILQSEMNIFYTSSNVSINSYCSFNPGGNYNTISGSIKYDGNNNGCDINDLPQSNIRVNINDGITSGATFSNNSGNYSFFTQLGNFNLTPSIENPTWFNFSPNSTTVPFVNNLNNLSTNNFCISANGIHNDVEVIIAPINVARPGFDAKYKVVYKNKGNQINSGTVTFSYDDSVLDYVSSSVLPNAQITGLLTFNYTNLLPFESRSFEIIVNVNSPVETPAVNIGDILNYAATINTIAIDENPNDNTFEFNQTVVGALDPNDITCLEGDSVSPSQIGNYLHYIINFENVGNFPAENIVLKDIIDESIFDVSSLQVMNSSNNVTARLSGNVAEFIFENIQLDSGGHGNILIKIKTKSTIQTGAIASKNADIFFDYNFPVNTGMANTTFAALNNGSFELDKSIFVYPNPTSSIINIKSETEIKNIELYDVQGRILQTTVGNSNTIDISDKNSGIYFLKISTENGSKVEKISKK